MNDDYDEVQLLIMMIVMSYQKTEKKATHSTPAWTRIGAGRPEDSPTMHPAFVIVVTILTSSNESSRVRGAAGSWGGGTVLLDLGTVRVACCLPLYVHPTQLINISCRFVMQVCCALHYINQSNQEKWIDEICMELQMHYLNHHEIYI